MGSRYGSPNIAIVLLIIISIVAASLSVVSFQYSAYTAEQIEAVAVKDLESQSSVQAFNLAKSLENRLQDVGNNLQILATTRAIKQQDDLQGRTLINNAEDTTEQFTDSYFWIDKDGRLVWAGAFEDEEIFNQYYGADRSDRPYFTEPRRNHQPYFSALRESVDGVPRLFMSYPVLDTAAVVMKDGDEKEGEEEKATEFRGVVVASFNLKMLGQNVNAQLPPGVQAYVNLMDRNGTILYAQNDALLGKNYFSQEVQELIFSQFIPLEQRDSLNSLLRDSLAGNSGIGHFSSSGVPLIIAYQPVTFSGMQGPKQHAFSLSVIIPKTFASDVASLIEQQRTFSTIIPLVIGGVAVAIAFLVIRWNRSLESAVRERTAELAAANEQLKTHDKMQTEFVNIAAHELRTPIQPILGIAGLLRDSLDDNKKETSITESEIALLERNAHRLQKLSSEILDATRIESGTLRLDLVPMDINEKVRNVIADTTSLIPPGQDIKIEFKPATDPAGNIIPLPVMIDRLRIFEVISNLIRNAIKYSENQSGGNSNNNSSNNIITISTSKVNDTEVAVAIRDNGRGIHPDLMPRLFTKFAMDREKGGTGLGLFLAKNIIEAHGGRIWAENNKDGKGATFSFTLPLANSQ